MKPKAGFRRTTKEERKSWILVGWCYEDGTSAEDSGSSFKEGDGEGLMP